MNERKTGADWLKSHARTAERVGPSERASHVPPLCALYAYQHTYIEHICPRARLKSHILRKFRPSQTTAPTSCSGLGVLRFGFRFERRVRILPSCYQLDLPSKSGDRDHGAKHASKVRNGPPSISSSVTWAYTGNGLRAFTLWSCERSAYPSLSSEHDLPGLGSCCRCVSSDMAFGFISEVPRS